MPGFSAIGSDAVGMSGAPAQTSTVSADLTISYAIYGSVSADLSISYAVRGSVSKDLAISYVVNGAAYVPVGISASTISAARKVVFSGGVRVVAFQGSKKTVRF